MRCAAAGKTVLIGGMSRFSLLEDRMAAGIGPINLFRKRDRSMWMVRLRRHRTITSCGSQFAVQAVGRGGWLTQQPGRRPHQLRLRQAQRRHPSTMEPIPARVLRSLGLPLPSHEYRRNVTRLRVEKDPLRGHQLLAVILCGRSRQCFPTLLCT
ncbi:hypothetical protein VTK56DRAFT_855 [Thermocarpiscus australiensis]